TTLNGIYRITEYRWTEDMLIEVTLLEAFDDTCDTVSGDYTPRTFPPAPGRSLEVPPKPTGLALTATPEGILARINPLGKHAYDLFEWQISTESNFASIEDTIRSPDSQLIFRVPTKTKRYVRVRAK